MNRLRGEFDAVMQDKSADGWYKSASVAIVKLQEDGVEVKPLIVARLIEELLSIDTLNMLNSLDDSAHEFDALALGYVKGRSFIYDDMKAFPFAPNKIFVKRTEEWSKGEPEDYRDFSAQFKTHKNSLMKPKQLADVVGFLWYNAANKTMVFKNKETDKKRNKGIRCFTLKETKKILERIEPKSTFETNDKGKVFYRNSEEEEIKMSNAAMCAYNELLLRHFHREKKDKISWFLTPFETELINIS